MTTVGEDGAGYRFLAAAGGFVLLVAGIKTAAPIMQPMVLALFLAVLLAPVIVQFRRLPWPGRAGFPHWLAVLLTLVLALAILGSVGFLIERSVEQLAALAPAYRSRFDQLASEATLAAARYGVDLSKSALTDLLTPEKELGILGGTAASAAGVASDFVLVFFMLVFLLVQGPLTPAHIEAAFGREGGGSERLGRMTRQIQTYMAVKTVVSALNGLLFGTSLWLLGVDFALLWGSLAFLLHYIPNVGALISVVPPTLLALLQYGLPTALAVALLNLVISQILGQVLEPRLTAHTLGLSPAFVMFALVFWGWVWGAVGVVLAVPLTVTVKILLENTDDLKWLAVFMDAAPREPPA